MNSFRSLVRQSISLGANAFQEKEKDRNSADEELTNNDQSSAEPDVQIVDEDNDMFQEVVENEFFDQLVQTWKPCDSDMTRNGGILDGKMQFPEIQVPDSTIYVAGDWEVESDSDYDDEGWSYGNNFDELDQGDCLKDFSKGKVRRRIWQRQIKTKASIETTPADSKMLPDNNIASNSDSPKRNQPFPSKRGSHRFPILNSITGKINGTITGMAQSASASLESAKGVSTGIIRQAESSLASATSAVHMPAKSASSAPTTNHQPAVSANKESNSSGRSSSPVPIDKAKAQVQVSSTSGERTPLPSTSPTAASSIPTAFNASKEKPQEEVKTQTPVTPVSSSPAKVGLVTPIQTNNSTPTPATMAKQSSIGSASTSLESTIPDDSTSSVNGGGSVNVDDNAAFEYEDDGSRGDAESVVSEAYSVAPTEMGGGAYGSSTVGGTSGAQKRRSFFSFGSSTAPTTSAKTVATSPKEGASASASGRRQSVKVVSRDNDPALRVHDSTLSAIGKQIKFIEAEAKKAEEEKLKTWKEEVKPHLESTIADLEKRVAAIKQSIEKEAAKGFQHISKLEEELEKKTVELDVAKRCCYFPYTDITLGTGGVYLALDDFWFEYCSGGYHIEITPDRSLPSISVRLRGVKGNEAAGVQARLQLEGFRLAGDKGKGVPKLNFSQIKVTIGFTADIVLKFNHKLNKWEINSKDFKINVVSFKGPYGINRSIVGLVLSLLTPTIRHALVDNLPFELGLMIKTMPTPFTIIGDFNVRGIELSVLEQEWHQAHLLAKMCDYSPTQMDMFYYLQRALDRSYPMKNMAEFLAYVKQFSKSRSMWEQMVHLWEQATMLYCEKVAMQKGVSELESSSYEGGLLGMPGYKIAFKTFLGVCEEMLMKRINVKCELKYIDGQFSLNHMVSFMYQIVHRLTNEAAANATSYKKVRLLALIDRLNKDYETTSDIVRIMGQNLDFVQVVVQASVRSGPEGSVHALATDICAQAPLSLDLNISAPKNIGALPLIPYVISFRPQFNGDVLLEIYHFNHDSSDVPSLLRGLHIPSYSEEARVRSETMGSGISSQSGAQATAANNTNVATAGGMTFGGEDNFTGRESESDAGMWNNISREHKFTNYENSIRTGVYSTSYNRVVNKIATGQANLRALGLTALRLQHAAEHDDDDDGSLQAVDAQINRNGQNMASGVWGLSRAEDAALSEEWKHLLIKREKQWQSLKRTLQDHPHGDEADTLLSVIAKRPKISVIVDRKKEFKSGAELVTVNIGKFETAQDREQTIKKKKRETNDTSTGEGTDGNDNNDAEDTDSKAAEEDGVPIAVHTASEIRLFTQVESAEISLHLPTLLRFVLAHFADLTLLRQYLEILTGMEFLDEHLLVFKMVLERMAKYLLLPVLTLDVNINGKLMALNGEIMILIETPQQPLSPMNRAPNDALSAASMPAVSVPDCAIELEAQISLRELLQDAIDIDNLIRFGTGESSSSSTTASNANNAKSSTSTNK